MYLKEYREIGKDRERQRDHEPLVHTASGNNSQDSASNFILVSYVSGQDPVLVPPFAIFSGH